jgi:hypothetical protein
MQATNTAPPQPVSALTLLLLKYTFPRSAKISCKLHPALWNVTMLDPLTALSLASSVMQIADFGTSLLRDSYRIYKFPDLPSNTAEIKGWTARILAICDQLQANQLAASPVLTKSELMLLEVGKKSETVAQDFLALLDKLTVCRQKGHGRALESVQKTFKAFWMSDKIAHMQERLDSLLLQVNTCILSILR